MTGYQIVSLMLSFVLGAMLIALVWLVYSLAKHRKAEAVRIIQQAATELIEQYRKDNELLRQRAEALKCQVIELQKMA